MAIPNDNGPDEVRHRLLLSWLGEHWSKVAPIAISLAALFVSALGYRNSDRSIEIADQSLQTARRSLVETQRPWLSAELVKHEGTDSYFKVVRNPDGASVGVQLRYRLSNTGRSPAKDVSLPREECPMCASMYDGDKKLSEHPMPISQPEFIAIGPGESVFPTLTAVMASKTGNPEEMEHFIQEVSSGCYEIETQVVWSYKGPIDPAQHYETRVRYKAKNTERFLLASEMR